LGVLFLFYLALNSIFLLVKVLFVSLLLNALELC